jgi:predicted unusual protein kinase regulating ubiquinone biosynthesis (AarF/ABC1/UbiB family)
MQPLGKPVVIKVHRRRREPADGSAGPAPQEADPGDAGAPVVRGLPRPARIRRGPGSFSPLPKYQREVFKASALQSAARLVRLLLVAAGLLFRLLFDWILRRMNPSQFGRRLRRALESAGGLFVKLGQQLSTRVDLLDQDTCYELAGLLDSGEAMDLPYAIAAVERVTGKPLAESFAAFDPDPVGSASVSCVYHARLTSGEEVAVKVRRPGIGELFAADLRIINLFLDFLELVTVIRPGFTHALREEIGATTMDELNFRMEARYQDLWRRQAKRDRQKYVTSPKVYFHLSGADVIVSEFATGVWVIDLLAIKESANGAARDHLAEQDISFERVAEHLVRARHWSYHENTFFHADPHPANVVVQPGSRLMFVDFGACGPTAHALRRSYVELFRRQLNRDGDGMVQVFTEMISPLPHLDLEAFSRFAERQTWHWLYAFESRSSEWWERTSAAMWIRMFEATRRFRIPVNARMVRLMRSTLLYETIAARLDDTIEMEKLFLRYEGDAERRALERLYYSITRFRPGRLVLEAERLVETGRRLVHRIEALADDPTARFQSVLSKASHAASAVLRLAFVMGLVTFAGFCFVYGRTYFAGEPAAALFQNLRVVAASPIYWAIAILLSLRTMRVIQFRLFDFDNVEEQVRVNR